MLGSFTRVAGWLALSVLVSAGSRAGAEDLYFHRAVADLTLTEGRLPTPVANQSGMDPSGWNLKQAIQPYATLDGPGEVYINRNNPNGGSLGRVALGDVLPQDVVAFRIPEAREVTGRLFVPRADGKGLERISFKVTPPPGMEGARSVFALAKKQHYERLLARNIPGSEWFLHQAREAEALAPPAQPGARVNNNNVNAARRRDLERTFDLFSGARAVDENLQLDRPMPAGVQAGANPRAVEPVKTDGLKGITIAEMDWSARLKGRDPSPDPLAALVPADQHALFIPGLEAAAALVAEMEGDALPALHIFEASSEERPLHRRYERQLGMKLADLVGIARRASIASVAVTGSDPYFPSGTDLAILFETKDPAVLSAFLGSRISEAARADRDAVDVGGEIDGVRYIGSRSPDRALSSYVAVLGQVVVLTNSKEQLGRLLDVSRGKAPALAAQAEYRFFRDRYARGDGDESAFLVLTDATIRRWCGPRWRIGSSRRLRASAALAAIQADNARQVATGSTEGARFGSVAGSIDLGRLSMGRSGVRSDLYGTFDFQTPILELKLDEVMGDEADAYGRWRDNYQQNWRGVFDPIALRLGVRPDRLSADLSVMPLIANSEYRTFLDVVGSARIEPNIGDRHPESLAHAIMAFDVRSKLLRRDGPWLAGILRIPQDAATGWIGRSVGLYVDDDPFWAELAAAREKSAFVQDNYQRVPIAAHLEVADSLKLALFLGGIRAYVDQSAPNLAVWENREHRGKRYVRIVGVDDASKIALAYFAGPRSITLSTSEAVIRRAIDRQEDGDKAGSKEEPWAGKSLAFRASRRGFEVLGSAGGREFRDTLTIRSWANLPILNEWKRLFPDRDPVQVHEAIWGTTTVDPAGGKYVWNERWATMESTAFGHPGEPRPGPDSGDPAARFGPASFGLDFEDGGLRAQTRIHLKPVAADRAP